MINNSSWTLGCCWKKNHKLNFHSGPQHHRESCLKPRSLTFSSTNKTCKKKPSVVAYTLQGTNPYPTWGKRNIIFKSELVGDMLVPQYCWWFRNPDPAPVEVYKVSKTSQVVGNGISETSTVFLPRTLFFRYNFTFPKVGYVGCGPLPINSGKWRVSTEPVSLNMYISILVVTGILGRGLKRGGHYLEDHPI